MCREQQPSIDMDVNEEMHACCAMKRKVSVIAVKTQREKVQMHLNAAAYVSLPLPL